MGFSSLPPGFRFHPTDDELVSYYLKKKVEGQNFDLEVIPVIELYKYEPWELPGMLLLYFILIYIFSFILLLYIVQF